MKTMGIVLSLLGSLNSIRRNPNEHVYLETDQLGRKAWESIQLPFRMPELNVNVLLLNMAETAQALPHVSNLGSSAEEALNVTDLSAKLSSLLGLSEGTYDEKEKRDYPYKSSIHAFMYSAMDMTPKHAYENHSLAMKEGKGSAHSGYTGV